MRVSEGVRRIGILYRLSSDLADCTERSRSGNSVSNIDYGMVASSGQGKHRSPVTNKTLDQHPRDAGLRLP